MEEFGYMELELQHVDFLLFIAQRNDYNAGRAEQDTTRGLPSSLPRAPTCSHEPIPLPLGSHSTLL